MDLQTENADLIENVGAIPFLDYKHFASKIFFPEVRWSWIEIIQTDAINYEVSNIMHYHCQIYKAIFCYCFSE